MPSYGVESKFRCSSSVSETETAERRSKLEGVAPHLVEALSSVGLLGMVTGVRFTVARNIGAAKAPSFVQPQMDPCKEVDVRRAPRATFLGSPLAASGRKRGMA